ncbi:hypothetical protein ACGFJT_12345 [Actinomadura geliboluensis]|uniref:hypothetical protein n=1 Tax=Actinomadura geliboluensis TaxID=882440 RepID=UPI00372496D8
MESEVSVTPGAMVVFTGAALSGRRSPMKEWRCWGAVVVVVAAAGVLRVRIAAAVAVKAEGVFTLSLQ